MQAMKAPKVVNLLLFVNWIQRKNQKRNTNVRSYTTKVDSDTTVYSTLQWCANWCSSNYEDQCVRYLNLALSLGKQKPDFIHTKADKLWTWPDVPLKLITAAAARGFIFGAIICEWYNSSHLTHSGTEDQIPQTFLNDRENRSKGNTTSVCFTHESLYSV